MTYKELYDKADRMLYNSEITFGEYETMIKPLKTEIKTRWIPVSERLPEDLEPVNVTWVNRKLKLYYEDIKDKPFTATALRANCRWYWWSTRCVDMLKEYGRYELDEVDYGIEITAWMPLPEPYKAESEEV